MGNLQTKWPGTAIQPPQSNSPPPSSSSSFPNCSGQPHLQPPLAPLSSQEGALCGELQGKLDLKGATTGEGVERGDEVDDDRDIEGWESNSWEHDCVRARVRVSVNDGIGADKRKKRGGGGGNKSQGQFPKVAKEQAREREEPAETSGQTECKYYPTSGGCTKREDSTLPAAELNFLDLPIRPGEKDCPYYMQHYSCEFGGDCKYNHPDPTVEGCDPPSPVTVNNTSSFVPMMLSPTQVSPQGSDWNAYQEPIYPSVVSMHPPTHIMNNPAIITNTSPQQQQMQVGVDEFAEIPEDSKSKSKRKSRRQKNKLASLPPCNLNDKGLPLGPAVGSSSTLLPNQTKGSRSMRCEVCKIDCNSKDAYEKHISGKKHKNNMQINANPMLAHGGNNVGSEVKKPKLSNGGAPVDSAKVCTVCNIVCNSQDVYNKHIAGKKHAAQVALMSNNGIGPYVAAFKSQGIGPWKKEPKKIKVMQPVWCDTCKVTCNSRDMYASHLVGKKHLKNLEKQSKPEASANANAGKLLIGPQEKPNADKVKSEGKPNNYKPNSKKAKDLDIEANKLKVVEGGTLCNVVCNSETVFNAHLAGHKHASMVKKQTLESSGTSAS
ncbi:hypothetical protein PIB30_035201 [Stylosanthes scabra]|uniref:C3H1-type domain-containing protein n=1 Tax=Stylosanthes scabra TaxID=79078 RepID=A0ABU6RD66_9FABA|nr:hypothetical protein [Stylosanthes scabra]